ncbi:6515_t:CDS:1, partial [Acaulospora colombiana]
LLKSDEVNKLDDGVKSRRPKEITRRDSSDPDCKGDFNYKISISDDTRKKECNIKNLSYNRVDRSSRIEREASQIDNKRPGIQNKKGLLASISRTSTGRWASPQPPSPSEARKPSGSKKTRGTLSHAFDPNKKPKLRWTEEEDCLLLELVKTHGKDWNKLSEILGRPYNAVSYRYTWITSKTWTPEETARLHEALKEFGDENEDSWSKIKERFPDRTLEELKHNFKQYGSLNPKSDKPLTNVGTWTNEELEKFEEALDKYAGEWKKYELAEYEELWRKISEEVKTRSGRQCRRMYYWQYSRPYEFDTRIKYEKFNTE